MLNLAKIHKGMDVLTSDGFRIGVVREVMEHVMFLDEVEAGRQADKTTVPMIWIVDVDNSVRLAKSWEQVQKEWNAGPQSSL